LTSDQVDRILAEYDTLRTAVGDPELEALKAAVFIEDVFGVRLGDADIDPEQLCRADAMRALVLRKLGAH
jgi:hypothetical protein